MNVAILGASDDPERYAYKALMMLMEHGHKPFPVNPSLPEIEGIKVLPYLTEIKEPIHTLTMYVRPEISTKLRDDILKLKPSRVIFNPGSENAGLSAELKAAGVEIEEACTLVLLSTGQF